MKNPYVTDEVICTIADEEIFLRQCKALEMIIPGLEKEFTLQDVDSSRIQTYLLGEKRIKVKNDLTLNMVLLETEVDLEPYFK